jgi:hypothetical protein
MALSGSEALVAAASLPLKMACSIPVDNPRNMNHSVWFPETTGNTKLINFTVKSPVP